jgi:hypothetical protein
VRPRALLSLLVLTAGDYLLWQWSIAGSHDVLSLLAGFTLVPLLAVSAWRLALVGAGLLSRVIGRAPTPSPTAVQSRGAEAARQAAGDRAAESDSSSGRLAA